MVGVRPTKRERHATRVAGNVLGEPTPSPAQAYQRHQRLFCGRLLGAAGCFFRRTWNVWFARWLTCTRRIEDT